MLDLLIIHPGRDGVYGDLPDHLIAVEPPLWDRLIAGYIRDHGFTVQILDAEAEKISPAEVAREVAIQRPRLVCLAVYGHQPSASTQQMPAAGAIARAIRDLGLMMPTIMVGGHVSALPEQTLDEENISYACKGEGPVTVLGLLRNQHPKDIPGLVWRTAVSALGQLHPIVTVNKEAPLMSPEQLHGDAWDLLPMNRYRSHNWQMFGRGVSDPYASVYTSLGCPYRCAFCCINAPFGSAPTYRMREPKAVVDEMVMLYRKYGVRTFKITDEMFILKEGHYREIAGLLIDSKIAPNINIWAYARVDTVKPNALGLLRKAGFRWLALGIESGSKLVRDGAKKALKHDDIAKTVRAIQDARINVIGNYIFGLPDDDMASMQETLRLALDLNTEFANFYSAMAYPGSPLYEQALALGRTLPSSWIGYSQHSYECRPLDTAHVSAREVLAFRDMAFQFYFGCAPYLDMVERKFGPATRKHVHAMTRQTLRRQLLEAPHGPARDRLERDRPGEPAHDGPGPGQ